MEKIQKNYIKNYNKYSETQKTNFFTVKVLLSFLIISSVYILSQNNTENASLIITKIDTALSTNISVENLKSQFTDIKNNFINMQTINGVSNKITSINQEVIEQINNYETPFKPSFIP